MLGTGGGGDPHIGRLLAARALGEHGTVTVLDPDEVDDDAFIVPVAQMGAPTVGVEKIPAGTEPIAALRAIERYRDLRATATMPVECGGMNSMVPLLVAAHTGLPVVDGDGMGRAFPELQMKTFSAYGLSGSPMAITGERGDTVIVDTGNDDARMEWLARGATTRLGGAAYVAEFTLRGDDMRRTVIPRTLSLALRVGKALRDARRQYRPAHEALAQTIAQTDYRHLRHLFTGKIVDVERRTDGGFARGSAHLNSFDGTSNLELTFQNEHLLATRDQTVVCMVPDLVCVLDAETAEPITTEGLRFGQRVSVVGIATPPIMRAPEALAAFGPAAFGLPTQFHPVEELLPADTLTA